MTTEELKQATISQYDDWLEWNGYEGSPIDLINSGNLNADQRAYVESVMYILGGRMMVTELDLLREDLKHQLNIPDELDWDYFLETAEKAKHAADKEGRNMVGGE